MCWLTAHFHPGFAGDLTSWITKIKRDGGLVQIVNVWPDRRTVEFRAELSARQLDELDGLIAAVDFSKLAELRRQLQGVEEVEEVAISVRAEGAVLEFSAPLLFWARSRALGAEECLPTIDVGPALQLWEAIDRCSPRSVVEV